MGSPSWLWGYTASSPGRPVGKPKAFHKGRALVKVLSWARENEDGYLEEDREWASGYDDANILSSQTEKDYVHRPVLDIDIPHEYHPSSTPGHAHLYFDVDVPEEKYWALLEILSDCGIIEEGYKNASIYRGSTQVRLPHIKKEQES